MAVLAREDVTESFLKTIPTDVAQLQLIAPVWTVSTSLCSPCCVSLPAKLYESDAGGPTGQCCQHGAVCEAAHAAHVAAARAPAPVPDGANQMSCYGTCIISYMHKCAGFTNVQNLL